MRGKSVPIITILVFMVASLVSPLASAAIDDMNLTGLIYLDDGTTLSITPWANNTSFAIYVDHNNDWSTAWRYPPSPQWYTTSMGAYSTVLPASEKDKNWSDGDWYRVEFDVSAISGVPGQTENATSNGTGDPGEITPFGATGNVIVWNSTDNWQRWDVVLLALPDLAVLPGDVTATPGVVQVGQAVPLSATVRNLGNRSADALFALFFDANANMFPDPSEVFDVQPISLFPGENDTFVDIWFAAGAGTHSFCAYADADNSLQEEDEGNNVECASVLVEPPPLTRPDYVPVQADPPSPARSGLSQSTPLSIRAFNDGNGTATGNATLSFYNQSSLPFAEFAVEPLAPGATSQIFTATWMSPAVPGVYNVSVNVDYYGNVTEWDETNNVYTWTMEVVEGPITSLVVGNPNHTAATTYVRSSTPLDFSVVDQSGMGILNTTYRIDNMTWENYTATGQFFLAGEGGHYIEWYSEDYTGNVEDVTAIVLIADDSPPTSTLSIGNPNYLIGGNFITSSTPLGLQAIDGGITPVGLDHIEYQIDGGGWNIYSSQFFLAGEGPHTVDHRSHDLLTNEETTNSIQLIVDVTPPTTTVGVGQPKYQSTELYIASSTEIDLASTDGGAVPVGLDIIQYRIDSGTWQKYTSTLTLTGSDGPHVIEFNSSDLLGNIESVNTITLNLDNTSPITTLSPATGPYSPDTVFTLTATDSGCGVNVTRYRIDGGTWIGYSDGFTVPEGDHNISFYSIDNLDNTEEEKWLEVTIQAPLPNTPPTVTITSPAGGEEWLISSSHTITWTMHDDQDANENLTIYANYTTQGAIYSIGTGLKGMESYLWTLPDTEAQDVVINFTVIDTGGLKGWAENHVTIKASPPPSVEANYKPLVALIFAIVLAVVGLWSSRRRPWKNGDDRRAVAMAFAFTCLPFILAEVLTGILSLFVDPLKIPPVLGWGMGVDVLILVAGVMFFLLRLAWTDGGVKPQHSDEQEQS